MARPRLTDDDRPSIIMVKLRLYRDRDADLIAFFDKVPDRLRAASVKQALRTGRLLTTVDDLPSDEDIEAALDALLS